LIFVDVKPAIIIPTYNRPELLKRAVKSALAQKRRAHEVVVVNDGQRESFQGFPGVKHIETKGRQGPTVARAVGINALENDTNAICYLDDDDELLPNHLETLVPLLEKGADFAFSVATYRYPNGTETTDPEPSNPGPKRYYDPNALLAQNIAPISCFLHTRRAYDLIGGWDKTLARMEDWDFWARMSIAFGPPAKADVVTNVIYKGLDANRTDSNQYVYSMACHWRDFVEARLCHLERQKRGRLTLEDHSKFRIPRVSVIMPCYNCAKYLPESMASVLSQTFQDFEVVAVDDGSDDGTQGMLEDYSRFDGRVRVFRLPRNMGVTKALNHGLLMSRTEYLARMDADDVSLPSRLELQVKYLDENPDVWVLGTRFWSMDEGLGTVKWDNAVPTSPDDVKRTLSERCCVGHPTVMMRRRMVEKIGGYDEDEKFRAVEDYELWLRASSKGLGIANLPEYLLKYREHRGQVTERLRTVQSHNLKSLRKLYGLGR
jgi:glycosyltransferase involved in cell wall biosynthesis